MSATGLIVDLVFLTARALVLFALSRILFEWVMRGLMLSGRLGGCVVQVLRLPGNALHELSHAIGYIVSGYRVKAVQLAVQDPQGRGRCAPGERWAPWAIPWMATAVAALMPMATGTLALWAVATWLQIDFVSPPAAPGDGALLRGVDSVRETLLHLDFGAVRTWAFLLLTLSIGAELAPSDVDLRRSAPATLAVGTLLTGLTWALGVLRPHAAAWEWYSHTLAGWMPVLERFLNLGILATAVAVALTLPFALALRAAARARAGNARR
jgi:hypothetical protein